MPSSWRQQRININTKAEPLLQQGQDSTCPQNREIKLKSTIVPYDDQKIRDKIKDQLSLYIKEKEINIPEKYLKTLTHIISTENKDLKDIPLVDLKNMLRSLRFAEVSIEDKCFKEYNIKLIEVGAVVFTWFAEHGTSIFNGSNNPSKLNYVKEISETARLMQKAKKPVIIVFSSYQMNSQCISEMNSYFVCDSNIITLCMETELDIHIKNKIGIAYMDQIRLEVINSQDKVMLTALKKSENQKLKTVALENLKSCSKKQLIYSDIDNVFKRAPDFLIAFDGVMDAPILLPSTNPNKIDHNKYPAIYSVRSGGSYNEEIYITNNAQLIGIDDKTKDIAIAEFEEYLDMLRKNSVKVKTASNHWCYEKENPMNLTIWKTFFSIVQSVRKAKHETIKNLSFQNELDNIKTHKGFSLNYFEGDNGFIACSSVKNSKFEQLYHKSKDSHIIRLKFHYESIDLYHPFFIKNGM